MAKTIAATIGRATSLTRRLTQVKRIRRSLGFGTLRLWSQVEQPQEGRQAVSVLDLASPDENGQLRDRNPFDAIGFA
jgi:hypothetical protein